MEFMYITFLIYFIKAWVSKKFYSPLNLKKDILSNNTSLIHALHSTTGQNASYGVNVPHNYVEQGRTVGAMLAHAQKHGYNRVEVTKEVEDDWVKKILSAIPRQGMASCTPGYYNNEGRKSDMELARYYGGYPQGPLAFFKYIQQWRSNGKFEGVEFSSIGQATAAQSRL
jgi:hypothetical protein